MKTHAGIQNKRRIRLQEELIRKTYICCVLKCPLTVSWILSAANEVACVFYILARTIA